MDEKMIEREKELLELNDLIFKHSSEGSLGLLAKAIQQSGYTKENFPIEKLEVWLEKGIEVAEKQIPSKWAMVEVQINAIKKVLKKIKELEGET